jgi:type II secretory pathway pseudopilin PulG
MVARPARRAGAGFTYVSVMVLVAVIALAGAATLKLGSVLQRSRLEAELLAIGAEYADALQSYADATPAGQPTQPRSFKELLRDLRRIYVDPLTGSAEWGIVYAGDKAGIVAIYSLSDAKAVKIGNFPERFRAFEGRTKVSDWKFSAGGKPAATAQQAANAGGNQGTANPGTANPGTANPGTANPALQQPGSLFPAAPAQPQQDGPAPEPAPPPDAPPPDAPQPEKPASQPDEPPPPQEPPDPARDVENAPPPAKPQQR